MPSISGDHVISYKEYWREVKSLAKQAKKEKRAGYDPTDIVHELVDGHQWIIYTAYNPFVLIHSQNEDALFDSMGSSEFESYSDAMAKMAYFALEADVMNELGE